jgi:hypothetical protein
LVPVKLICGTKLKQNSVRANENES